MNKSEPGGWSLPVLHPFSQIGGAMGRSNCGRRFLQSNWGGNGFYRRSAGRFPGGSSRYRRGRSRTYATQMFLGWARM